MRIAQINLPLNDNAGKPMDAVHHSLAQDLCTIYGGFTSTDGQGAWVDAGKLYLEPVRVYQVAYVPLKTSDQRLRDTAQYYGRLAGQIAMFIVIDGEAEIIEIE